MIRPTGSWSTWGPARRRFVALMALSWLLVVALAGVAILLHEVLILAPGALALAVHLWAKHKLSEIEDAEDGPDETRDDEDEEDEDDDEDDDELLPDEEELWDKLAEAQ